MSPLTVRQPAPARDLSVLAFWMLLAAFVALWTVTPWLSQPNLPIDSIEMLHWGHEWQWGYYKHPPLPAWVAQATSAVFGTANWPLYLVAEVATAVSFWAVWRLGREFMDPWLALCGVAALQGCYLFNWSSSEVNNNTLTRPFWCLAVLMLYWALERRQLRYWVAYAAAMAVGLYSKYDVLLLGAGLTWLLAWNRQARQAWRTPGPYLAAAIIVLLMAPHAKWLVENDYPTLRYAIGRSDDGDRWSDHVVNPLKFALKQSPLVLPVLSTLVPLLGMIPRLRRKYDVDPLARDLLLAASVVPAVLLVTFSAISGGNLRTGWTSQIWSHLGLLALASFELQRRDRSAVVRSLRLAGAYCAIALAFMPIRQYLGPVLRGKPSRVHFPGEQLAAAVDAIWRDSGAGELPIVAANDWWTAAQVNFYSSSRPASLYLNHGAWTPWTSDAELARRGGVLVEQVPDEGPQSKQLAAEWRARFANAGVCHVVTAPWRCAGDAKPAKFLVMTVTPPEQIAIRQDDLPLRR
jgi:4-amino-4-deoxy-L-arabinose transferase-like glycosyltransferase